MLHDPQRCPPPTLQDLVATLRSAGIFSRLPDAQLLTLARHTRLVSLAAGETLFRHGDKARALYLLVRGQLKLYRASAAGDEVIIDLLEAGTTFGETGVFREDPHFHLSCAALVTTYLPRPLTSSSKADGRFGKPDFLYDPATDTDRCPAGERLIWRFTNVEAGMTLHNYWASTCPACAIRAQCTTSKQPRRIRRWEHEAVVDALQQRLDREPDKMRVRRQTAEHPFGTLKAWMGHTHFLTRTLPRVSTEMSLHVLAYNLKRVLNVLGVKPLLAALAT